jgi:branched-chain amino acid transport system ATP-binding protein
VTLIGSNGAGKTTTMRAISGMIKPKGGKDAGRQGHHRRLAQNRPRRAGPFAEGRRVFASMSVTDNLLLGAFPRFTRARPKGDIKRDLESAGTVPAPEGRQTSWPARCPAASSRCWPWRAP